MPILWRGNWNSEYINNCAYVFSSMEIFTHHFKQFTQWIIIILWKVYQVTRFGSYCCKTKFYFSSLFFFQRLAYFACVCTQYMLLAWKNGETVKWKYEKQSRTQSLPKYLSSKPRLSWLKCQLNFVPFYGICW